MTKGLGVDLNLGELISDGIQKIKIKAKDGKIDVTITKHRGSTVDLDAKAQTIDGDFEGNSSIMAINIPEEMRNVRLKIIDPENDNNSTLPQSPHSEPDNGDSFSIPEDLGIKAFSLVEDYVRVGSLCEASKSIQELRSPGFHPEIVKTAMLRGLYKNVQHFDRIAKLIMYLLMKKVLSSSDLRTGCVRCSSLLNDYSADISLGTLSRLGLLLGKLVSVGGMDFKDVVEIVVVFDDDHNNNYRAEFFNSLMDVVGRDTVVSKSVS